MSNTNQIKQMINTNLDSTPNDKSDDPEWCICLKCDYECGLGIDDDACDTKKCPKCGGIMSDSVFNKSDEKELGESVQIDFKTKMKKLMESKQFNTTNNTNKCICTSCKTIISNNVNSFEEGLCPSCGDHISVLTESVMHKYESMRRFICPKCETSTAYVKINEDACPVCSSLMTVFDVPSIKKSKSSLPLDD